MASIDQVWDHNSITYVKEFSGGVIEWEIQHIIRETDQPTSKTVGAFRTVEDGYQVQGTVTNEQQQGDTVIPARLRFSGGINKNGSVEFTVRTAEAGGANQQDYPIADVAPRRLTPAQMASGAANRINAVVPVGELEVNVVEITPDEVYDVEMLVSGSGVVTDCAFLQLTHVPGDLVPAGPD